LIRRFGGSASADQALAAHPVRGRTAPPPRSCHLPCIAGAGPALEEMMTALSPTLRDTITEGLTRALALAWIGGFFVAVEAALLKLLP
jgi:hypothetical protein